eukprot:Skav231465  [mRNA]  locus=scaffold1100:61137:62328:- [translate_table: standard]
MQCVPIWRGEHGWQKFYTDGSAFSSEKVHSCQSYWALVWDECEDDSERAQQAERFLAQQKKPTTLKTIHKGTVQGKQSIDRAEITAINVALNMAEQVHIFSDSSYALGILQKILAGTPVGFFQRAANFDLIIEMYRMVGMRTSDTIRWTKLRSHTQLTEYVDMLELYHALGNDAADEAAKGCHEAVPVDTQHMVDAISAHEELWSKKFMEFCKFSCSMTYMVSNFFSQDQRTNNQCDRPDRGLELAAWNYECPKMSFAIPRTPEWESNFLYGEQFMLALRLWLEALQWPVDEVEDSPGITWLELYVDFVVATGVRTPTCTGFFKKQMIFQRAIGSVLLKDNPLIDQVNNFRVADHKVVSPRDQH